jgi:hypothetical protein
LKLSALAGLTMKNNEAEIPARPRNALRMSPSDLSLANCQPSQKNRTGEHALRQLNFQSRAVEVLLTDA